MTLLLMTGALALLCTATAVLLAATGGRDLIHTEHPLPEPDRRARRSAPNKKEDS